MNNHSIDIVVPTYRLNEKQLLDITHLPRPDGMDVRYYIVVDNTESFIPQNIATLQESGIINLIIHKQNLGPAAARNTGIRAGSGEWILFLDDDIVPKTDLLTCYMSAIEDNPLAIGFVGQTVFPDPFNAVTKALSTGGWISHFTAAKTELSLRWAPTANIMLRREKMDRQLFDEQLRKSGEDIDYLVRNSFLNNEKYLCVPEAVVYHPWWNNGLVQTKRMWRYGEGACDISRRSPVREFTFRDFTNTTETSFLLLLLLPVALLTGYGQLMGIFFCSVLLAEYLTNWLRGILAGKTFSPIVAFHLMWAKNAYEAGFFARALKTGYANGFALRIDMGFNKRHPGHFRTNRWKIIKMLLIAVLFLVGLIAF